MAYDPEKYNVDLQDSSLKWIGMDLDGTLAEQIWPQRGIGKPLPSAVNECINLVARGYKIIIYTSRPWADYENIERWLNDHEIPWHHIQCGKALLAAYYDDKAIKPYWTYFEGAD